MNPIVGKIAINLVTGAMGSLIPKLAELLKEEYKLKKAIKKEVESLQKEMKTMHAALRKVAGVPRDQLDDQVKLWAGEVRELSFDMEDIVDKFLVHVDDDPEAAANSNKLKRLTRKMASLFTKGKARHEIAYAIKEINKQVQEVTDRHGRYNVDSIVSRPASVITIDPRLHALYREVTELVGVSGKRDQELMKLLSDGDSVSNKKLKMVSVVGFGGLGKTTLVRTVYNKIKGDFGCWAFVPVGRNVGAKKILMDILLDLDMYESQFTILDERQLIDKLRGSLENERYLIVIDDIWDDSLWEIINLAFSRSNNFGSRLITTTRIVSVSKLCCSSTDDVVYQMKPLSDDDSRRLFYKRIFSHESGGCPLEFEEVSVGILKKCGGVPLAIITISSLLVSGREVKPPDEWHVLLESIGHGLIEDPSVEKMLRILSFSYYDLPSHLKTCLLYLSMFLEDCEIEKDRLVWMWIAENFVQFENTNASPFEIGETYFNELMNRNMIQPVYDHYGRINACRVHDMILDLICSLSSEENFVTVLHGTGDSMPSESKVRRLSLQNARKEELQTTPLKQVSLLHVRSITAFAPAIDLMLSISSFVGLRVLDFYGCNISDRDHLNLRYLGSLLHLRYLGLLGTGISKIPEEVGKLQFLQVLDLSGHDHIELPSTLIKLRRLTCLLINSDHKRLPDGLGNLTSMEVLSEINADSASIVKELGKMGRLRKLKVRFGYMNLELEEAFVVSLGKLFNIQSVEIREQAYVINPLYNPCHVTDLLGERWVPPRSLMEFAMSGSIKFSTLPAWIRRNPSDMSQLSMLRISIKEEKHEDLGVLGRLPALRSLILGVSHQSGLLLVGADGFCCLAFFNFTSLRPGSIMFGPGAMPKAETVKLFIGERVAKEEADGNGGVDCFDLGMENLLSLRKANVTFCSMGLSAGEAKQAEAELGNVLRAHPNCPTFEISTYPDIPEGTPDDEVYNGYW